MTGTTVMSAWTGPIPATAGIGLRGPHLREFLASRPSLDWVEVHSENYFGNGIPLAHLLPVREHYGISLHGVGLSIGSTDPLNHDHLAALKALITCLQPGLVSEHLSWSSVNGRYLNDLLPLPYTEEALAHVTQRVLEVQERLGRRLLIENISSYLEFGDSCIPEWEFLSELAARSGCGILLDVNNIFVSASNHGFDPYRYLQGIAAGSVQEVHLAGFTRKRFADGEILIDTHNQPVTAAVWRLYDAAIARFGGTPTLIEWDTDLPPLHALLAEAQRAQTILEYYRADAT